MSISSSPRRHDSSKIFPEHNQWSSKPYKPNRFRTTSSSSRVFPDSPRQPRQISSYHLPIHDRAPPTHNSYKSNIRARLNETQPPPDKNYSNSSSRSSSEVRERTLLLVQPVIYIHSAGYKVSYLV